MSKYKRAYVAKLKAEGWNLDGGAVVVPIAPTLTDLLRPAQRLSQPIPKTTPQK